VLVIFGTCGGLIGHGSSWHGILKSLAQFNVLLIDLSSFFISFLILLRYFSPLFLTLGQSISGFLGPLLSRFLAFLSSFDSDTCLFQIVLESMLLSKEWLVLL